MADSPQQILESIPALKKNQDAAALVGLQDHPNKKVRKAARKAIHSLRSRGIEIPDASQARTWSGGSLNDLRGNFESQAMIDMATTPGLTRIMIAEPDADERGTLFLSTLSGTDVVLDFGGYVQTDGQRGRLFRDWEKVHPGRKVPVGWAKARLRWAREETLRQGHPVPPDLDNLLERLGDAPGERPASFLVGELAEITSPESDAKTTASHLDSAGVSAWPPVLNVEPVLEAVQANSPDLGPETPEEERTAALLEGAKGQEGLRKALQTQVANLLDDSAVVQWLDGRDDVAKSLGGMAATLRESSEPETLPWVGRLLGMQIASTLSQMARQQGLSPNQLMQQLQSEHTGQSAAHGEPGHVHGPDCDHDH